MSGWRGRLLSRATRLVLIQSVTLVISVYVMNTCRLPQQTLACLEKCNRDFLWGDWHDHLSLNLVETGGLDLRGLKDMNQVLLAKLVWRSLQFRTSAWSRTLQQKYGITSYNTQLTRAGEAGLVYLARHEVGISTVAKRVGCGPGGGRLYSVPVAPITDGQIHHEVSTCAVGHRNRQNGCIGMATHLGIERSTQRIAVVMGSRS